MTTGSVAAPKRSAKSNRLDNCYLHIFTPQIYQVTLVDAAHKHNTIACLGSNSSKTFIAVMVIKELAHKVRHSRGKKGVKTFFFVDSESTATQYARVIGLHTDLAAAVCMTHCDSEWFSALQDNHVILTTASTFLAAVRTRQISVSNVNLVVFDDCHLAACSGHAYTEIVDILYSQCEGLAASVQPLILGLTSSILNEIFTPDNLNLRLTYLEKTFHSRIQMTSDAVMADPYSLRPREFTVECDQYVDTTGLVGKLSEILRSALNFINDMQLVMGSDDGDEISGEDLKTTAKLVLTETERVLLQLGPWCAARVAAAFVLQLMKIDKPSDELRGVLHRLASTTLRCVEKTVDTLFDIRVQTLEDFNLFVNPKAIKLIDVLRECKPDDNFVIMSGDFDGDFESDGDCAESADSMDEDDDVSDDGANVRNNSGKSIQKIAAGGTEKNSGSSGQHYIAVRRSACNGNSDGSAIPEQTSDNDSICSVVFVSHRHVAFALNKLIVELCNWDPDLYFVRSHYIAGYIPSGAPMSDAQRQKQENVLRKFRQREYNVLVATTALEEGVDLPRCNLVVRYDQPTSYRSYMLSKGRARASNAKYCVLVYEDAAEEFGRDLALYRGIEKILLDRCRNKDDYSSEPVDDILANSLVPPYHPKIDESSFKVSMLSAIRIINRYCSKLPSDAFTHLTPRCRLEEIMDVDSGLTKYRAILQLPINSVLKRPIVGDAMPGRRLAQMAVALKACSELHEAKELDDHLQPVGRELIRYEDEDCEWEDHELHGQARPGSTKRKQYYSKKLAASLLHRPQPDIPCCLYSFRMTLTCPITEEQNTRGRPIHAPEDTSRGFGFLCAQQMPSVPSFPVFTRSGEVSVTVDLISSEIRLTSEQLSRLYKFHHFVFCHVLRLEKSPMIFNPEHALYGCVVVPINSSGDVQTLAIDWDFVELIEESPLAASIRRGFKASNRHGANSSINGKVLKEPKESFVFDEEKFADAVVMPSYRNIDQPQYFYVAEIRHDLNPRSSFPSPELYDTFEHYYKSKYNLTLTSHKQPLLDVDHTSARLNLLTPRYVNQKGVALLTSSATTRRAKRESLQQKQILVPELCDIHPFPASLWRKAVCVPAMLYRTNCLLIAEELRARIAKEARIGSHANFNFRPLKFDYSESAAMFIGQIDSDDTALHNDTKPSKNDEKVTKDLSMSMNGNQNAENEIVVLGNSNNVLSLDQADNCHCKADNVHSDSLRLGQLNNDGTAGASNHTDVISEEQLPVCLVGSENSLTAAHYVPSEATESNAAAGNTTKSFTVCSVTNGSPDDNSQGMKCAKDEGFTCGHKGFKSCNGDRSNGFGSDVGSSSAVPVTSVNEGSSRFSVFSLDADLTSEGGPSPCDIIQTLTMSNANDFFNLERLETIGDSFLKFAVTIYLYCTYTGIHEGKLSYLRSLQVSNYNLYRLGKRKNLPECMIAVKFEPSENWLPPGYTFKQLDTSAKNLSSVKAVDDSLSKCSNNELNMGSSSSINSFLSIDDDGRTNVEQIRFNQELEEVSRAEQEEMAAADKESTESSTPGTSYHLSTTPYCLQTQHSLPDKSIADCVEALIGCYLASCGRRSALLFMDWLGLRVLPANEASVPKTMGIPRDFGCLPIPVSPLLSSNVLNAAEVLAFQLDGYDEFEKHINYRFNDRSYLLQAFTHASYHYNNITDCYQRLEFLGDAILDYVITRHLFEDSTKHSPGVLTDLRSALVNNNMFACLAVRWNFHKFFKAISPQLFHVIEKFVLWQMEHDYQVILDEEMGGLDENEDEDIEIPKALGDIFESVAGAIYLDSGMSLDAVWTVYHRMMKPHIDVFLEKIPKSPVRELLEMEPETAKFEKPERTIDGKIRVCVNVVGKGNFTGVGRNYRIAKSAAAKRALKVIKMLATKSEVQQMAFSDFPLIIRQ